MIEVDNLVKWYGPVLAVDGVSFRIPQGEIVGFLGPNGAGKSTTLRILTGFMPATSGAARIAGHDVFGQSQAVRDRIGYLPESTPLYADMRVEEYLHFRGKLHGMRRGERVRRIGDVCERCELAGVRRRVIGRLSRGNRQRVGLAAALLHEPPVLILDEPTAGLDPNQITRVRRLIGELRGRHTVLLSTHILHEVEKTADRVIVIAAGRVVAQGTPDDLRRSAASEAHVVLEVKASVREVVEALNPLDAVEQVKTSQDGPWCQAEITPRADQDPPD